MRCGSKLKISCILLGVVCWAIPFSWLGQTDSEIQFSSKGFEAKSDSNVLFFEVNEDEIPLSIYPEKPAILKMKIAELQSAPHVQKTRLFVPTPKLAPKLAKVEARPKVKNWMSNNMDLQIDVHKPQSRRSIKHLGESNRDGSLKIRRNGIMGRAELQFKDVDKIQDFAFVRHELVADMEALKQCLSRICEVGLEPFASRLRAVSGQSETTLLGMVNAIVNEMPYRSDRAQWGKNDHWARPFDTLLKGGDCEDYALLKFAALTALGIDEKDMRLVIGYTREGVAHVNLNVKTKHGDIFLDNRFNDIRKENGADIVPRYSVNLSARWTHLKKTDVKTLKYAGAAQ